MNEGYVKFLGDYSKLKSMGYAFQKLYANNYMQWSKDGFRVWKKGADITHDDIDLYKFIKFMRTKPTVREYKNGDRIIFWKFYSDADKNIYDYYPMDDENNKKYRDNMHLWSDEGGYDENNPPPYLGSSISVSHETIKHLEELNELGWYELIEYKEDQT